MLALILILVGFPWLVAPQCSWYEILPTQLTPSGSVLGDPVHIVEVFTQSGCSAPITETLQMTAVISEHIYEAVSQVIGLTPHEGPITRTKNFYISLGDVNPGDVMTVFNTWNAGDKMLSDEYEVTLNTIIISNSTAVRNSTAANATSTSVAAVFTTIARTAVPISTSSIPMPSVMSVSTPSISKLSNEAIAAVSVGGFAALIIITICVFLLYQRGNRVRRDSKSHNPVLVLDANNSRTAIAAEGSAALNTDPIVSARNSRKSLLERMGISLEILRAFVVMFFPLACLSAALITIVQVLRIQQTELSSSSVLNPGVVENGSGAYLVRVNSSTLSLLASYCSSIAPLLAAYVMGLFSYQISRHLLSLSEKRNAGELPTPYQLGLLITLLKGDTGALWDWLKYTFVWRTRHKMAAPVRASALALLIAFLLGLLFTLADSWLHVSTTTIQYVQLMLRDPTNSFGREWNPFCKMRFVFTDNLPCSIDIGLAQEYLVGGTESYKTLANISTTNRLFTASYDGLPYVYLGDVSASDELDFQASTVAINTQCTPVSQECNLLAWDATQTPYNCSAEFFGNLFDFNSSGGPIQNAVLLRLGFFNDSAFRLPTGLEPFTPCANPCYLGMAVNVFGDAVGLYINGTENFFPDIGNDPEVILTGLNSIAFILSCNVTVYEATYTWINGSFNNFTSLTPSNNSVSNVLNGPLQNNLTFGIPLLQTSALISVLNNNSQEVADYIALSYSQTAMGLASGVFLPQLNILEQNRKEFIVARVPYAPFYTLIGLNMLYVTIGASLAVLAVYANTKEGVNKSACP